MATYKPYRKTDSAGTLEEIKIPYSSIDGTPTIPDVSGKLSKTENTGVNVLGTTKSTTTLGGNQLVAPNGIIFAGTAANAGLVTRGICGVTTPDSEGACSKENLYINYDGNNDFNAGRQVVLNAGAVGNHLGSNMYQYAVPRGDIVKAWVEAKGYLTSKDISGKANLEGGNTFSGVQTINAPTNASGSEQTTMKVKTPNGGAIVFGKEGPNSGTMIRLDQADGTCRLRFRSSETAGAMVWEQPEQGAQLYVDLGKDGSDKHRVTFPSSAGTLALTSQINNGTLTIQQNGTKVQTFTANQSSSVTANITVPTKVSQLTNDSGYTANKGTVTKVKINGTTTIPNSEGLVDLGTISGGGSMPTPIQVATGEFAEETPGWCSISLTPLSTGWYLFVLHDIAEQSGREYQSIKYIDNNGYQKFLFNFYEDANDVHPIITYEYISSTSAKIYGYNGNYIYTDNPASITIYSLNG